MLPSRYQCAIRINDSPVVRYIKILRRNVTLAELLDQILSSALADSLHSAVQLADSRRLKRDTLANGDGVDGVQAKSRVPELSVIVIELLLKSPRVQFPYRFAKRCSPFKVRPRELSPV